jgi:hypothetical protein
MTDPLIAPKPTSPSRNYSFLIPLALAVVAIRWAFLAFTGVTFEDSLISLRYAENFAAGFGMVYNVGERVFGASTPLHVLFLAALTRLGLPAIATVKLVSACADGVTVYLWARWFVQRMGSPRSALAFALLFGLSPLIVHVSVSGMETSFAVLFLTLALLGDLEDRPVQCGIGFGLLMLVRPDGAIAATVVLGLRWLRTRKFPLQPAALAILIVLPWIAIATWYYGTPLPNSIPAKAAAYNLHRTSILPNLRGTLAQFVPFAGSFGQIFTAALLCPLLILGSIAARKNRQLWSVVALFGVWWAYLVLPRTLIFTWYYPLLLLPAYVVAGSGVAALEERSAFSKLRWSAQWSPRLLVLLATGLCIWLCTAGWNARRVQVAESTVRKSIGYWLRDNTPEDARIAMEPIGYIGYYSRRRILDEVGLVSPEMVPLNRVGVGWFPAMIERYRPEYIVERPVYLVLNQTLNSRVPIFGTQEDRERFVTQYEPVAEFSNNDIPKSLVSDYRFVIFRRRSDEEAREWQQHYARLARPRQEDLIIRAMTGLIDLRARTAERPAPLPVR